MSTNQGNATPKDANRGRQLEERSHADSGQILGEHESDGNAQEDQQRPPSRQQIAGTCVDANSREEIHQKHIPRLKLKLNSDA